MRVLFSVLLFVVVVLTLVVYSQVERGVPNPTKAIPQGSQHQRRPVPSSNADSWAPELASAEGEPNGTPADAPTPGRQLQTNPIARATAHGLDAASELSEMLESLSNSGAAAGDWLTPAQERIGDVTRFVSEHSLGSTSDLGCYAAGCALKVSFRDSQTARHPEELSDPSRRGAWPHGVVITQPRAVSPSGDALVSWIFFLAPPSS